MPIYEATKDILVPLLSPLVAALAIIFAVKQERQKLRAQHEHTLQGQVRAAERELLTLREMCQHMALQLRQGEPLAPERVAVYEESCGRLFKVFHDSPAAYDEFFSKRRPKIKEARLPLLITELETRMRQLRLSKELDTLVLFGLYLLLYARAPIGADAEEANILGKIYKTDEIL
jgi:hypothetical protein